MKDVSKLFDGDCAEEQQKLVAAAQNEEIRANLFLRVYEVIEWGILSAGSDREEKYCDRKLYQFTSLQGHPLFQPFEYQQTYSKALTDLSYEDCIRDY